MIELSERAFAVISALSGTVLGFILSTAYAEWSRRTKLYYSLDKIPVEYCDATGKANSLVYEDVVTIYNCGREPVIVDCIEIHAGKETITPHIEPEHNERHIKPGSETKCYLDPQTVDNINYWSRKKHITEFKVRTHLIGGK